MPKKPGAWVDLGLTLPIFVAYHLGVVFLKVRNGTDLVTGQLLQLAEGNRGVYVLITLAIGVVFAGVFSWLARGEVFRPEKFLQIAIEGVAYAVLMRLAGAYAVQSVFGTPKAALMTGGEVFAGAVPGGAAAAAAEGGRFVGLVMSMGAGFYEELTFRVILFGLGAKIMVWLFARETVGLVNAGPAGSRPPGAPPPAPARLSARAALVMLLWSLVAATVFSGIHYVGPLADSFQLSSFTFRFVLGMALTLIYALRGFAAVVWAHTLYDVWVLVF